MSKIKKVGVIGAGTMGSGIASHVTNAGIPVVLLDLPYTGVGNRNQTTEQALEKLAGSTPPAFMDKGNIELIQIGNTEDDLDQLSDADWIAEAVVERIEVKQNLYTQLDKIRKPNSLVSSNTSTIPLARLTERMEPAMRAQFCITHFFNPVRYMRLLELVGGPATAPDTLRILGEFCDVQLGKGVVSCNDTPGFLGNRVGVYALQVGITAAAKLDLTIEEADAVMGRPMGIPKTGVFGLYDLIGLDLMLDVAKSLARELPDGDPFHTVANGIELIPVLCNQGYVGNKGKGGFYRTSTGNNGLQRQSVNLVTGEYHSSTRFDIATPACIRDLVTGDDKLSRFAWEVLSKTLNYSASLIPETAIDVQQIDDAMKLGYGWQRGPFELIDELGIGWFVDRLRQSGHAPAAFLVANKQQSIYRVKEHNLQRADIKGQFSTISREPGIQRLSDTMRKVKPLLRNEAASLWDIEDGIGCIEFHSKANALSPASMELVTEATSYAESKLKGLVIYNEAPHFSVGFNLDFAQATASRQEWQELDRALDDFQKACLGLLYSKVPVVAAPAGLSLGGGYEVVLHCDRVHAHTNSVMGLVETIVGLIPSGGGCKELLHRWTCEADSESTYAQGAMKTFELIGMGKTGTSPIESRKHRFFRSVDRSVMNRDRLMFEAKKIVSNLYKEGYEPRTAPTFKGLGNKGQDSMNVVLGRLSEQGIAKPHDVIVGRHLANVLCGYGFGEGEKISEQDMCTLERENFIALAKTEATMDRISHMLSTGRPLRN